MHWLSKLPLQIADHHARGRRQCGGEEDAAEPPRSPTGKPSCCIARASWSPAAKFVFANFCEDEQGHYLGHTGGVNMHDTFAKHWRNLLQDGTISEAEYRRANFVQFYKTKDRTSPRRFKIRIPP